MTPIRNVSDRERQLQAEIDRWKSHYEQREEEAHQLSERIIKIKADREDLAGLNMKQGDALMQLAAERDALKADALRYRGLRQMCVQLSLSNDTTAMLLKDQSELDSTMKEGAK